MQAFSTRVGTATPTAATFSPARLTVAPASPFRTPAAGLRTTTRSPPSSSITSSAHDRRRHPSAPSPPGLARPVADARAGNTARAGEARCAGAPALSARPALGDRRGWQPGGRDRDGNHAVAREALPHLAGRWNAHARMGWRLPGDDRAMGTGAWMLGPLGDAEPRWMASHRQEIRRQRGRP